MSHAVSAMVFASHNLLYALEPGTLPEGDSSTDNGLVSVQQDGRLLLIHTGTHTGEVSVTVELHDQAPALNVDDWDDIVEVSATARLGQLGITGLTAETESEHLLPELSHAGPGTYRVRVHVRGRDAASADEPAWDDAFESPGADDEETDYDGAEDDSPSAEEFLISAWPAPLAPPAAHKLTDDYGAKLRSS